MCQQNEMMSVTFPDLEVLLIERRTGQAPNHFIKYAKWRSLQFLYDAINRPTILQVYVIVRMPSLEASMMLKLIRSKYLLISFTQFNTP